MSVKNLNYTSSVAWRGRARAPPLACEVCKIARFWCFWSRFLVKNWKQTPRKEIGCRSCEVQVVIRPEKAFEFPVLAEKSVSISVKTFFFFFNGEHLFLGWKTFVFPNFPRNSVSIFGQTVWFWYKNNENSGQGRLHFSHSFKKAPPFPNPGYAPELHSTCMKNFTWKIVGNGCRVK